MSALLRLAWRNIWRNGRRSVITSASVGFGLAAIMFGQSLIRTIQHQLIDKATGVITGHLQVVDDRVANYKFPEKSIEHTEAVRRALSKVPGIEAFERRILVTGLVSSKADSIGVLVVGLEPEADARILRIHSYVSQGRYLSGRGREIVLGDGLAKKLGLKLGDKAVVMAQAFDGSLGAENYTVVGLTHTGSKSFDEQIIYLPLSTLQEMLAMDGRVNNFVARLKDPERLEEVSAAARRALSGQPVRLLTWRDVDQELVGIQKYQNAIMTIMLGIIFAIVALGILNTLLMSMFERIREFGVLMAIGARPAVVVRLVVVESFLLGLLGMTAGVIGGCLIIVYFGRAGLTLPLQETLGYFLPIDPILYLMFSWQRHATALGAVVATSLLASIPAALRVSRLKPAEALRHI